MSRGSRQRPGVPGGVVQGLRGFGGFEKTRKTLQSCMARLLRSYIHHFVQDVPVKQMAQGTYCLLPTRNGRRGKGEVKPPNSVQHATQGSADF